MSLEAQLQIRQNATEVHDFMKDLFDWEKSMKKKDAAARKAHSQSNASSASEPAVRGRARGEISAAPKELQTPALDPKTGLRPTAANSVSHAAQSSSATAEHTTAAAHTYSNYKKWDNLDVDALLASDDETDGVPKPAKAPKNVPPPAPMPIPTPPSSLAALEPSLASLIPRTQPQEDLMTPVSTTKISPPVPIPAPFARAVDASQPQNSNSSSTRDLPPVRNQQPQTADAWRTRGNDLFKVGEYDSALKCYSSSISVEPSALAYANRAMAHLKLNNWKEAEADCDSAIALDPSYVKAYHRRGTARRNLGRPLEAAEDFEFALRLEPTNKAAQADRDSTLQAYMKVNKLQPVTKRTRITITDSRPHRTQPTAVAAVPAHTPLATPAPAPLAVQPPTSPAVQPPAVPTAAASAVPSPPSPSATLSNPQSLQQPTASPTNSTQPVAPISDIPTATTLDTAAATADDTAPTAVASISQPAPASSKTQVQSAPTTLSSQQVAEGQQSQHQHAKLLTPQTPILELADAVPKEPTQQPNGLAPASASNLPPAAIAATHKLASKTLSALASRPPKTSTEFENAWRSLQGDLQLQAAYLQNITPPDLPTIFKSSLTAPMLTGILRTLLNKLSSPASDSTEINSKDVSQHSMAFLQQLPKVPRFDMTALSIPSREKTELKALWDAATQVSGGDVDALQQLRKAYKL